MIVWIDQFEDTRLQDLVALMRSEWWCKDRKLECVKRLVERSDAVIGALHNNELVGCARVLTDCPYKAVICDVIVKKSHRGTGLGKNIISKLLALDTLKEVQSFELYCPEKIMGFYQKLGFVVSESKLMYKRELLT